MKVSVYHEGKLLATLLVTPKGDYAVIDERIKDGKIIEFKGKPFGNLRIKIKQENYSVPLPDVIEVSKALTLCKKGLLYYAYISLGELFNESFLNLVKDVLGENVYKNLLVEAYLGSFKETENSEEYEEILKELIETSKEFYTHVVGFYYRKENFYSREEKRYVLSSGDKVYALWDGNNPHDKNAVAIYHQNGHKLGYVRKTIAKVLVEKVKEKGFIEGEILEFLEFEDYNSKIYIKLIL